MATIQVSGIDGLIVDLETLAEIEENGIVDEMLIAGGEVMQQAQKKSIDAYELVDTGQMKNSITVGKPKKSKNGKVLYVYPKGARTKEYKTGAKKGQIYKVRNAEIAFINEFGAPERHIPARPFMEKAVEDSGEDAVKSEEAVFDNWLEQTIGNK